MAVDMFLKIEGVTGEAQDKAHKDEIDVLSWSWGMSQSGTTHMGSGAGAGKVNVQDLSLTKYVDASTPVLMLGCCTGEHYTKATLIVRKAGKSPLEYVKIEMTEVIVASISTGGSGGEDRLTENLALNFAKVTVDYKLQNTDGSEKKDIPMSWDIAANVQK